MIRPEELAFKLVLNSIFKEVLEDIVLCLRQATAWCSHCGRGNGKKTSGGLRKQGLNEHSQLNNCYAG